MLNIGYPGDFIQADSCKGGNHLNLLCHMLADYARAGVEGGSTHC